MKAIMTKEKRQENLNVQLGVVLGNKASLLTQGHYGSFFEGFNIRMMILPPPPPPKK